MEDKVGWHGKAPNREQLDLALEELGAAELGLDKLEIDKLLKVAEDYQKEVDIKIKNMWPEFGEGDKYQWTTKGNLMVIEKEKTRVGFGKGIAKIARENKDLIGLGTDITKSINMDDLVSLNQDRPDIKERQFKSMGIAEQLAGGVATGLAIEGKNAAWGSYAQFSAGRAENQNKMAAYDGVDVFIEGGHGGLSVGPDGATHQATGDISVMHSIVGMNVVVPCDELETQRATEYLLTAKIGPKYLRVARESTPKVTKEDTPFEFGKANIIKYTGKAAKFIDAFETKLAEDYTGVGDNVSIFACGPIVAEAMRAAYILKEEKNINVRVINMHTLGDSVDKEAIYNAAKETEVIVTAEEHQIGGLAHKIALPLLESGYHTEFGCIGIKRVGESGTPDELAIAHKLRAGNIAAKVIELYENKN